ncbi:hypothetical protein [Asticcacaulis sp.]|uniref:hypothetical protein n=1 Tax=Asticcacaulis sp. TaxID=1872648 RepID=UPI002C123AAE|nr:hypothetical protein [Asticcacaulis sp.]HTM79784.1 hypothetical protein [Asticcacaulis sp.]
MPAQRWLPEEDALVRQLYPDFPSLLSALPRRTKCAIRFRGQTLKLTTPIKPWLVTDISRLRQAREDGISNDEIRKMFPERNWEAIYFQIKSFKILRRHPREASAFRHPAVGSIRKKMKEAKLPIVCLARRIGAPNTFAQCERSTSITNIIKAVHYLGGEIDIVWSEQEG